MKVSTPYKRERGNIEFDFFQDFTLLAAYSLYSSGSKLGAMAPQGAMGLLPGSLERILQKKKFQVLILKFGLFEFFEFLTH